MGVGWAFLLSLASLASWRLCSQQGRLPWAVMLVLVACPAWPGLGTLYPWAAVECLPAPASRADRLPATLLICHPQDMKGGEAEGGAAAAAAQADGAVPPPPPPLPREELASSCCLWLQGVSPPSVDRPEAVRLGGGGMAGKNLRLCWRQAGGRLRA